jgi:hypothetical protein
VGPEGKRFRGIEATAFGEGSATNTFSAKFFGVKECLINPDGTQKEWDVFLLFEVSCTLGTMVGAGGTFGGLNYGILSTEKVCDTIGAPTLDSYMTKAAAAYGGQTPSVHAPGSNGEARLFIPDVADCSGIIIDFDMTGATSGNFLLERVT